MEHCRRRRNSGRKGEGKQEGGGGGGLQRTKTCNQQESKFGSLLLYLDFSLGLLVKLLPRSPLFPSPYFLSYFRPFYASIRAETGRGKRGQDWLGHAKGERRNLVHQRETSSRRNGHRRRIFFCGKVFITATSTIFSFSFPPLLGGDREYKQGEI